MTVEDDRQKLLETRDARPEAPNTVTIFGAGIAGLTAAHELVERGFQVQVWEPADNQRYFRRGCEVGGMARTQWSRVHWPELRNVSGEPLFDEDPPLDKTPEERSRSRVAPTRPRYGKQTQPIVSIDQKFYIQFEAASGAAPRFTAALGNEGLYTDDEGVSAVLQQVVKTLSENPEIKHIYAEFCDGTQAYQTQPDEVFLARVDKVLTLFKTSTNAFTIGNKQFTKATRRVVIPVTVGNRPIRVELVALDGFPSASVPPKTNVIIGFRIRERWLPGEHGYRFFPSFYTHVFDTMRRIPLLEPADKSQFAQEQERAAALSDPVKYRYTENGRTAYDNLRPLQGQVLAFTSASRPEEFSRFRPRSFEEVREYIRVLFSPDEAGGFGLDPRDGMRMSLRGLQFLTSCDARRRDYESMSWWDFIKGETLGEAAQRMVERWPRALVAMDAHAADARTFGIGLTQLVLDLARPDGFRDGSLRGPTNEAWLNPWRRYLEAQGVEFIHGRLRELRIAKEEGGQALRVWPVVDCYEPRYAIRNAEAGALDDAPLAPMQQPDLMPGYFILALPPLEARRIAKQYCQDVYGDSPHWPADSDLAKMARFASDAGDAEIRRPKGRCRDFRHFVGIQFYFAEDVFWADGHVYYPDSPWALTSVSQARFWDDRTDWEHGYRGILSVIVGDWKAKGRLLGQSAADCKLEEIAQEVWDQIRQSVKRDLASRSPSSKSQFERTVGSELPQPLYWHVDDNLATTGGVLENASPFPITAPGSWEMRPGSTDDQYVIEHGIVLAGAHMKTFTRLTTMESANESGRRAVNAILSHEREGHEPVSLFRRTLCDVWNPESCEIADLQWLKDLDAKLHQRGVDHVFEVAGFDELTRDLLRGGPGDPFDPVVLMSRLRKLLGKFMKRPSSASDWNE